MRRWVDAVSAGLLFALAACGGGGGGKPMPAPLPAAAPVAFPAAPLPMYSPGDSYGFSNGVVDTVVSADAATVHWRTNRGAESVTTRDVMLPPLAWTNAQGSGERSLSPVDPLFPLRPDSAAIFGATVTDQPHRGPETHHRESWHCRVGRAERLNLPIGSFDTVPVSCMAAGTRAMPRQERRFDYAPALGFYVRRTDRIGDRPLHTVTMTSYSIGDPPLSDDALKQRVAAIQRALTQPPGARAVSWSDGAGAAGVVEPFRPAGARDGQPCRTFAEEIEDLGRRYALRGEACQAGGGAWQVVSVAPLDAARAAGAP